ncbi:hypothetical protein PUNSTDRAFT_137066 [Punctularia strigosozonata HHB-11173 SS5]|uniref:uncharacterized protein n=1 Tax=Punctularia strigosozonata (strain HHB-11173) TaxID=741275 RepID=UPI0004416A64|nr:uncharacterized protein PUNSTDRAFT_137066 [Punctularia strigosozonata HHB-11173 SS5]EIN06284.1 hypothetical protein PUNSTDRAFT_137066 [Punctularia strigosozonata HHB-11173 SS5]
MLGRYGGERRYVALPGNSGRLLVSCQGELGLERWKTTATAKSLWTKGEDPFKESDPPVSIHPWPEEWLSVMAWYRPNSPWRGMIPVNTDWLNWLTTWLYDFGNVAIGPRIREHGEDALQVSTEVEKASRRVYTALRKAVRIVLDEFYGDEKPDLSEHCLRSLKSRDAEKWLENLDHNRRVSLDLLGLLWFAGDDARERIRDTLEPEDWTTLENDCGLGDLTTRFQGIIFDLYGLEDEELETFEFYTNSPADTFYVWDPILVMNPSKKEFDPLKSGRPLETYGSNEDDGLTTTTRIRRLTRPWKPNIALKLNRGRYLAAEKAFAGNAGLEVEEWFLRRNASALETGGPGERSLLARTAWLEMPDVTELFLRMIAMQKPGQTIFQCISLAVLQGLPIRLAYLEEDLVLWRKLRGIEPEADTPGSVINPYAALAAPTAESESISRVFKHWEEATSLFLATRPHLFAAVAGEGGIYTSIAIKYSGTEMTNALTGGPSDALLCYRSRGTINRKGRVHEALTAEEKDVLLGRVRAPDGTARYFFPSNEVLEETHRWWGVWRRQNQEWLQDLVDGYRVGSGRPKTQAHWRKELRVEGRNKKTKLSEVHDRFMAATTEFSRTLAQITGPGWVGRRLDQLALFSWDEDESEADTRA